MRILPSIAVMEKKVFKAANAADIPTSDAGYLTSNEEFVCSSVVFSIFLKACNREFFFSERQMFATVNCSCLTDFDGVL